MQRWRPLNGSRCMHAATTDVGQSYCVVRDLASMLRGGTDWHLICSNVSPVLRAEFLQTMAPKLGQASVSLACVSCFAYRSRVSGQPFCHTSSFTCFHAVHVGISLPTSPPITNLCAVLSHPNASEHHEQANSIRCSSTHPPVLSANKTAWPVPNLARVTRLLVRSTCI